MLPPDGWQYKQVARSRLQSLLDEVSIEELIRDVLAGSELCHVDAAEPCDEAKRDKVIAHRVSFQLQPSDSSARVGIDCLLNGGYGLRARHCHSPEEGSRANAIVCREITEAIRNLNIRLANDVSGKDLETLAQAIAISLRHPSAKVWFDAATDKRAATADDGEVSSAIWDRMRREPKLIEAAIPCLSQGQIAFSLAKGRTVPLPAALDINGAFIRLDGTEYVAKSKR